MRVFWSLSLLLLVGILGCGGGAKERPDAKKIAADKKIPDKEALKKIADGVFHLVKFSLIEDDTGYWPEITAQGMDTASVGGSVDTAGLNERNKNVHVNVLAKHCREYIEHCRDRKLGGLTVTLNVIVHENNRKISHEMFKISIDGKKFDKFLAATASRELLDDCNDLKKIWKVELDDFDNFRYETIKK